MELQIVFDRNDRLYRFGEVISGKVVVKPESDQTYSEIWITYYWRTHGRGKRDYGRVEKLVLAAEQVSLRAGDHAEFVFRFAAPNGPVTYHGYYLNVDWYLTAHARSGPWSNSESEQDFLLLAGNPTDAVVLGAKEVPLKDLPARSPEKPTRSYDSLEVKAGSPRPLGTRYGKVVGLFLLLFILSPCSLMLFLDWSPFWAHIISIATLVLLVVTASAFLRNAYKRKLELGEVWVRPDSVYGGGEVYCHVDFVAKREIHLRSIMASISARERVTYTAGTTTTTEFHLVSEKTYTRPINENFSESRWIAFDCALPLGPDAPASFSSTNNALEWSVTMKSDFKGWPDWQKTLPITILPYPFADKQDHRMDNQVLK